MSYLGAGFIREEKDVMYLILYALRFFPFAISEGDLMDVVLIDDGFGYFEFRSAFLACWRANTLPRWRITEKSFIC